MVTVWLQKALLLQLSVARQVRVTLNILGQRGTATLVTVLTKTTGMFGPSQLSLAVGMSKNQSVPHCTSLSGPQWMFGGVVSRTRIRCWQLTVLLHRSVMV
jgi:hypothetical protein